MIFGTPKEEVGDLDEKAAERWVISWQQPVGYCLWFPLDPRPRFEVIIWRGAHGTIALYMTVSFDTQV